MSIAVDVPTAWAAAPKESPYHGASDMGEFHCLETEDSSQQYTQTTTAAVSAGMPPIDFVTSMAIGVVTDFGASE